MKKFLKKYWLAMVVVLAIFPLIAFLLIKKEEVPTPSPTPSPFGVSGVYPAEGSYEIVIPNLAIEVNFSKEIDLSTVAIKIDPDEEVNISLENNKKTLIITPVTTWKMNTNYVFTIRAFSTDGSSLEKPFEYKVKFTPVTDSDLIETY